MKTLNIKLPIGQTLIQALGGLAILLLLLEGFVRIPPIQRQLAKYEFYGSSHPHFDAQVRSIRARAEISGKIDCVFVGNSQVLYDIDPAIVEDVYLKKTGEKITCQNFGLGGVTPIALSSVIKVLIKNFHPSVIILGTNLFDYSIPPGEGARASIMASPWFTYQLGKFSVDGWLIENSLSYQYYLGIDHYILAGSEILSDIEENGHSFRFSERTPMTLDEQTEYFDNTFPAPALLKAQTKALDGILKLQTKKIKIIVLETPMTSKMFDVKRPSKKLYPQFVDMLKTVTERAKSELWLTQDELDIPEDGWYDLIHLNKIGATYYSTMIGEKLGEIFLRNK